MGMKYFMPEICYHERNSLLSVDIFPYSQDGHYRIVTSSTKSEIRIWEFEYDPNDPEQISITFVANLVGHCGTVNQVKFSPNPAAPLLASGDAHGALIVWQLVDKECDAHPIDGLPQNRERWTNKKKYFLDNMGVNAISWSPCGKSLACVSGDGLRVLDALSGSYRFVLTSFRYFPNGVTYDPEGKYIVVMSTDRRLDIICADKGRRIKSFGRADMPEFSLGDAHFAKKNYSLFHSDLLTTFTRVPAFSPCGQILVAPAGCLELGPSQQFYCTYVFKVSELKEEDHPKIILPSPNQPTFLIKFCPIIYELVPDCPNYSGLPHRVIWLAMSREEIVFYDSQHAQAIGLIQNITYHCLSDAAWSKDGTTIAVSDMEEYMHFISFTLEEGVVRTEKIRSSYELPVSDRGEATEKVSSPEFDAEAALLDLSIQPYVSPSLSPEHDEEKLSGRGEETPTIEIRNCCFENNDELTHQKVRNSLIVITKNLERTRSKVEEMKANCYDLINDSYLEF